MSSSELCSLQKKEDGQRADQTGCERHKNCVKLICGAYSMKPM